MQKNDGNSTSNSTGAPPAGPMQSMQSAFGASLAGLGKPTFGGFSRGPSHRTRSLPLDALKSVPFSAPSRPVYRGMGGLGNSMGSLPISRAMNGAAAFGGRHRSVGLLGFHERPKYRSLDLSAMAPARSPIRGKLDLAGSPAKFASPDVSPLGPRVGSAPSTRPTDPSVAPPPVPGFPYTVAKYTHFHCHNTCGFVRGQIEASLRTLGADYEFQKQKHKFRATSYHPSSHRRLDFVIRVWSTDTAGKLLVELQRRRGNPWEWQELFEKLRRETGLDPTGQQESEQRRQRMRCAGGPPALGGDATPPSGADLAPFMDMLSCAHADVQLEAIRSLAQISGAGRNAGALLSDAVLRAVRPHLASADTDVQRCAVAVFANLFADLKRSPKPVGQQVVLATDAIAALLSSPTLAGREYRQTKRHAVAALAHLATSGNDAFSQMVADSGGAEALRRAAREHELGTQTVSSAREGAAACRGEIACS